MAMEESVDKAGVVENTSQWLNETVTQFNLESLLQKVGSSTAEAIRAGYFFAGAFAIGFIFKKYFKFILGCILFSAAAIWFLNTNHIITIDWQAANTLVGVTGDTFNVDVYWEMAKTNWLVCAASILGFIFGYKLG